MTITGYDSTGQTAGENVLPPRQVTAAEDLDAELRALEGGIDTVAPLSPRLPGKRLLSRPRSLPAAVLCGAW